MINKEDLRDYLLKENFGKWGLKGKLMVALAIILITIFGAAIKNNAQKNTKNSKKYVIVIDAGHGGSDPGKVGRDGTLEKDLNLQIALRLKTELEARGHIVYITRTEDICLADSGASNKKRSDMNKRVEYINSCNADFLISIHQNSFTDSSVKGAQVFYHGTSEEGENLASRIQDEIRKTVDSQNTRKIKQGNDYFILRKSKCPGVIVECGFLSNIEETDKLKNPDYQDKIVKAISDAVEDM